MRARIAIAIVSGAWIFAFALSSHVQAQEDGVVAAEPAVAVLAYGPDQPAPPRSGRWNSGQPRRSYTRPYGWPQHYVPQPYRFYGNRNQSYGTPAPYYGQPYRGYGNRPYWSNPSYQTWRPWSYSNRYADRALRNDYGQFAGRIVRPKRPNQWQQAGPYWY